MPVLTESQWFRRVIGGMDETGSAFLGWHKGCGEDVRYYHTQLGICAIEHACERCGDVPLQEIVTTKEEW